MKIMESIRLMLRLLFCLTMKTYLSSFTPITRWMARRSNYTVILNLRSSHLVTDKFRTKNLAGVLERRKTFKTVWLCKLISSLPLLKQAKSIIQNSTSLTLISSLPSTSTRTALSRAESYTTRSGKTIMIHRSIGSWSEARVIKSVSLMVLNSQTLWLSTSNSSNAKL